MVFLLKQYFAFGKVFALSKGAFLKSTIKILFRKNNIEYFY